MGVAAPGLETSGGPGMEPPGPISVGAPPPPEFGAWNEPQLPQQHPGYSCPAAWGYGENEPGQPMHAEPGQLGDNEPPLGAYYGAR